MKYSEDFIERVRAASDLVEVISQHTQLKPSGSRMTGRCPFPDHDDRSPSFSVSADLQLYFCYGCKKGGNIFKFLQTFQGMSFPEAVEFLARKAGIPLPEDPRAGTGPRVDRAAYLRINRMAAVFFHRRLKALPAEHPVLQYLTSRGIDSAAIETFRLGVNLDEWDALAKLLQSQNVPLDMAQALGLVRAKKAGGHYDLFRERVIFPILAPTGDVLGFGGRTYADGLPKYMNSPETPVFHKGRTLYGLHETGRHIRALDQVILVEGYMDVISLYIRGVRNAVAILGTALTADHAKILRRYTKNIVVLLDGDAAGVAAAERSLTILSEAGLRPKGMILPDKMDPDDYVRRVGAEVLQRQLATANDLFFVVLQHWMQEFRGQPSEKMTLVEKMALSLGAKLEPQLLELYLLESARLLDVEPAWLRKAIRDAHSGAPAANLRAGVQSARPAPPGQLEPGAQEKVAEKLLEKQLIVTKGSPRDEILVIGLALTSPARFVLVMEEGLERILTHEPMRSLWQRALERYGQARDQFARLAAYLSTQVDAPETLAATTDLAARSTDEVVEKLINDCVASIRRRNLQMQGKELALKLRAQADPQTLQQFMSVQRDRQNVKIEDKN